MRKTLLAFTMVSLMVLVAGTVAEAAQSENVSIAVRVAPALSVSLSSGSIDLGSVTAGSTTVTSDALTVTNNGSGVAEVFTLSHSSAGDWTSGTTAGDETYVLNAAFADTAAGATWAHVNSVISGSTAYDASQKLWFQFKAPISTDSTAQQSITVTVNAQLP